MPNQTSVTTRHHRDRVLQPVITKPLRAQKCGSPEIVEVSLCCFSVEGIVGPTPERVSVVARIAGSDPSLPTLLVHAHTDVVPVEVDDWSVPPFAGLIRDG